MKVLIAIDGSDIATAALQRALRTLGPNVEFVIVEVIDPVDRVSALRSAAFDRSLCAPRSKTCAGMPNSTLPPLGRN